MQENYLTHSSQGFVVFINFTFLDSKRKATVFLGLEDVSALRTVSLDMSSTVLFISWYFPVAGPGTDIVLGAGWYV